MKLSLFLCLLLVAIVSCQNASQALYSYIDLFYDVKFQNFNHTYPSDGNFTHYWLYAHGFQTVVEGARVFRDPKLIKIVNELYESQNRRGWHNEYFDDLNWMAITLLDAYELTRNSKFLRTSLEIYEWITEAWDVTCCGDKPGGMWWDRKKTQKATAANAGGALLAARLYKITRDPQQIAFSRNVFDFWWDAMVDKKTHQVCDHILPNGNRTWWKFTYNEGLMIGAATQLFHVTQEQSYLEKAEKLAYFMIKNEIIQTRFGPVFYDGEGCSGDCFQFKHPGFRYLWRFYEIRRIPEVYNVMKSSVLSLWNLASRREDNHVLFTHNWHGPNPQVNQKITQAQQNTAVAALLLFK